MEMGSWSSNQSTAVGWFSLDQLSRAETSIGRVRVALTGYVAIHSSAKLGSLGRRATAKF